jgi:DNA invertase Pin-like site-specific DNA recombinase
MEPIDTSTDLGLALVRVLVAFASLESATSGVRLRAKFKERAEQGIPHTTAAAYGIRKGWQELEPKQADWIREAARRVSRERASARSSSIATSEESSPLHTEDGHTRLFADCSSNPGSHPCCITTAK